MSRTKLSKAILITFVPTLMAGCLSKKEFYFTVNADKTIKPKEFCRDSGIEISGCEERGNKSYFCQDSSESYFVYLFSSEDSCKTALTASRLIAE